MQEIFDVTDIDGDRVVVVADSDNPSDEHEVAVHSIARDGWTSVAVGLTAAQVADLRRALRPYEEVPAGEEAEAFHKGWEAGADAARDEAAYDISASYDYGMDDGWNEGFEEGRLSAIDDHELVTREELELARAKDQAVLEEKVAEAYDKGWDDAIKSGLDLDRVAALDKAAEMAKELRTTSPLGTPGVEPNVVLAYAMYLLDELPIPAVSG